MAMSEALKKAQRKYNEKNRDKRREWKKNYYHRNKEEIRAKARGNPERRSRTKIYVPKALQDTLTERQKTVLRGKVRTDWGGLEKMLADTRMTMEEFVASLSVEELVKGKFRNKAGNFSGRPPRYVPREFQQACLRELMTRGQEMWMGSYTDAIKAMTDIACGRGPVGEIATPAERLKAAQFVVERMEGKIPERLVVSQDKPWVTVLDGIVAEVPEEAIERGRNAVSARVVEGEVVSEEYDDDESEEPDPVPVRSRRRRK